MTITEFEEEDRQVEQLVNPARCCPECGSKQYVFRGQRKIAAESEKPSALETRYLCKDCGHAWRECVEVKAADK
jgi:DNA-directed RNA polymerase subunit M/transcription elongation factor TFIIS